MGARLPPRDLDHVLAHTQGLWDDLRGQSVLITGATGFVGTWLLESLLWANDRPSLDVHVAAVTRRPEIFRQECQHLADHAAVTLVVGELATLTLPDGNFPFVVHAATEPSAQPDAQQVLAAFESDLNGTRRLLEFASSRRMRKLLFTSSGAVYGVQPPALMKMDEDYVGAPSPTDPKSSYGMTKRTLETMITMHGRAHGFDAIVARLFAFVGPRLPLDLHYAVGNFIGDALRGGPVQIVGDGTPFRSYLYAADLAIWLWTILMRGQPARPYNVGSPQAVTIAELAQRVVRVMAPGAEIAIAAPTTSTNPPRRYVPCTGRAAEELGLRPWIDLDESIRRTADWCRASSWGQR